VAPFPLRSLSSLAIMWQAWVTDMSKRPRSFRRAKPLSAQLAMSDPSPWAVAVGGWAISSLAFSSWRTSEKNYLSAYFAAASSSGVLVDQAVSGCRVAGPSLGGSEVAVLRPRAASPCHVTVAAYSSSGASVSPK